MNDVKTGLISPDVPPSGRNRSQCNGTSRQKAMQAVEYYNSNVVKARSSSRSFNERYHHQISPPSKTIRQLSPQDSLYRSNSSLELVHDHTESNLRREYGSHGSIDVIGYGTGSTGESFFAMLQDYRPVVLTADQRSPGPAEYLRHKVDVGPSSENAVNSLTDDVDGGRCPGNTSPKLKLKIHRFWGKEAKVVRTVNDDKLESLTSNVDMDERQRRRIFAHYDCQSLTANLGYAAKLRGLLSRRRNTTTGASAASMLATRSSTPDADSGDEDGGDGRNNDLVENCPYFRNEIGGEEERVVSLTRVSLSSSRDNKPFHRPLLAGGVSVLEYPPGETHWRNGTCPYQSVVNTIENIDHGALYYRKYFYGQEHQNWFGLDENLGPVAVSIKREKIEKCKNNNIQDNNNVTTLYQYRLIIRTSELLTLRGAVLEDSIPLVKSSTNNKSYNTKEVLDYITPEITLSCLRLGIQSQQTEDQLLKLDEQGLNNTYKVGVMYCQAGQSSEEDMYNNEDAGPAFLEFLETIGQRVRLKGFDKYRGGLDKKTDSTGLYSVYAKHQECEIMFHVSTLLPFTPNNRQQLLRKRHIGNDIVTIVFQEPNAEPFTPKSIRSQFQHVFIIVRAINPCTDNTQYRVSVTRSKEVPVFGPPIPETATFQKGKAFADFLLSKVINGEIAAHRSEKFSTMATRTRQEYLKDLVTNYSTSSMVETGQKFSIMSFGSKKKERPRPRFLPDATQRGALCWQVILEDNGQSQLVECFMGISTDSLVLIEERSREIVLVTPCKSILGWFIHSNSVCIYHHQGECTMIHIREGGDRDELMEILVRLRSVTPGCLAQELSLKRNALGQLGFHVQPDGLVTQVETNGLAYSAGLRQGARLVEICKVAVSTLTHDQMVDLLKTSVEVTVTVIPPLTDGSPRTGCNLQNCKYNLVNYEADYENLSSPEETNIKSNRKPASLQQAGNHRRKYERSFSPPRSSNSSGYGTGSSSKSFTDHDARFHQGMQPMDERWYEETKESGQSPPPLPARVQNNLIKRKEEERCVLSMAKKWESMEISSEPKVKKNPENDDRGPKQWNGTANNYYKRWEDEKPVNTNSNRYNHEASETQNEKQALKALRSIDYLITKMPKIEDGHTTDTSSVTSERLYGGLQSEDELSNGSSPRMKRTVKQTISNGNGSSRNQSPRLYTSGEVRLRAGVAPRGGSSNPNRNSANMTTSTLQQDLMKLINPDYQSDDTNTKETKERSSSSSSSTITLDNINPMTVRTRSRENLNLTPALSVLPVDEKKDSDVILTMARPATVISNTSSASSPAPSEMKLSREERLSPRVIKPSPNNQPQTTEPLPLPVLDPTDMDWTSLVDTATKAMLSVKPDDSVPEAAKNGESLGHWVDDVAERLGLETSASNNRKNVSDIQNHLSQLETRVVRETRRRMTLEDEVRRLRDENRRLQEESQAAAQQLRRFTEWFFQTIDRQ